MKSLCILFVTAVWLLVHRTNAHAIATGDTPTLGNLTRDMQRLRATVSRYVRLIYLQTKCESGILVSDYCFPQTSHECFNKKKTAQFKRKFEHIPSVTVGLFHLDLNTDTYVRVATTNTIANNNPPFSAYEATTDSVSVTFHCWGDSVCYRAAVSWMACGPVAY